MELQEGQIAPIFSLPDQDGRIISLSDYRGKWLVLYFYPKDDTPGCTTEACSMRDNLPKMQDVNAEVLGVSVDSVRSHRQFADKYQLPFTLLADEQKHVVGLYGVWGEKTFMGKTSMGTNRTTFIIDPEGVIRKIYVKVNPEGHAEEVVKDMEAMIA